MRMTGSALQGGGRCIGIASRRECWNWEGVQGEGCSLPDRGLRDADFFLGSKSMAGAVFSSLLKKIRILYVIKT